MFTGIIEALGTVMAVEPVENNIEFTLVSPLSGDLYEDQSLAHNGVCLTVIWSDGELYQVEAVAETLKKTNLGLLKAGDRVNLERTLRLGDRLDGHLVQGHVDTTAVCVERTDQMGSTLLRFRFPEKFADLVVETGSVTLNGISLTVFDVTREEFSVAVIPYTLVHTNLEALFAGHVVNLEFDLFGKYVRRRRGRIRT